MDEGLDGCENGWMREWMDQGMVGRENNWMRE